MLLKKTGCRNPLPAPRQPANPNQHHQLMLFLRPLLPAESSCRTHLRRRGQAAKRHGRCLTLFRLYLYTRKSAAKRLNYFRFFLVKGYPSPNAPARQPILRLFYPEIRNPNPRRPKEGRNPKSVLKKCRRPWFGIRASDFFRISGLLVILEILVRFGDNPPGPSPGADLQNCAACATIA